MGVRGTNHQLADEVLFPLFHAGDATAATALALIDICRDALDIAVFGIGNNAVLHRDQILDVHFAVYHLDLRPACIAELPADLVQIVHDDLVYPFPVCQDIQQVSDLLDQSVQFVGDLLALHAGELSQAHLHDCLCLLFGKSLLVFQLIAVHIVLRTIQQGRHIDFLEPLHQTSLTFRHGLAVPENGDHFVNIVDGKQEALENVRPFLCLFQVEFAAVGDNVHLELQILLENLFQSQCLWLAVYQCQHIDTDSILELGVGEQLVQHDLFVGILFQFHHDAHTLTAGLILDVVNALDALILCQVGDGLHQACLVHHVRDLRNDNGLTSTHLFKVGLSTEGDPASAGAVGGTDAALAHDNAAGGEVRSLDTGHQLIHGAVRIFHQHMDAVDDFAQIMRRNIGRHADSDTHRAVDQDIGETGRQHCRFFQTVVIVGDERHGLLVDIRQHFQGDLGHSCLCITVSSRRVAVYRTEVTLTVHQHIPHGEILRQTHQRIIDRSVTVGVIATQHSTDGIGALMVCLIGCQPLFEHGIENTAVYRFQTVTHVRQCTGNNDRHCILQEGVLHFSANFDGGNFLFSVGKEIFFFH